MQQTAKSIDWQMENKKEDECTACIQAKAKRMNLEKKADNPSQIPGERLFIDTSSVKDNKKRQTGKYWLMVVDECTSMKWSFFIKQKNDQIRPVMDLIQELRKIHPKAATFVRCDNAGENKLLESECKKAALGINFEFTASQTPQQNGKVERAFATIYGRMRAMMIDAGFEMERRKELWTEAASTATKLDNILHGKDGKSAYIRMYNKCPEYEKHLRIFGEIGVVTKHPGPTIKSKLEDRGIVCLFLGYARNHARNVYRMLNLKTRKVILTRDVRWTGKMYKDKVNKPSKTFIEELSTDNDDDESKQNVIGPMENVENNNNPLPGVDENRPRLTRELKGLQEYNNPG